MDALRCPPGERRSRSSPAASSGAWRCAGSCCRSPTSCSSTSRPTTWTPSRWPGWSSTCSGTPGTVIAVTHDRYFLDNVAGWILELDRGEGIPWKGNYSSWLEQKQSGSQQEEKTESRAAEDPAARAGVDPHVAQGPAGQGQGAHQRLRERSWPGERAAATKDLEIYIPPGPRLGDLVIEARRSAKAYGDRAADREPDLRPARPAASSASSAPTARARPRSSG